MFLLNNEALVVDCMHFKKKLLTKTSMFTNKLQTPLLIYFVHSKSSGRRLYHDMSCTNFCLKMKTKKKMTDCHFTLRDDTTMSLLINIQLHSL